MNLAGLLEGEVWLTADILLGLAIGGAVLRWGLADRLMARLTPWLRRHGIGPLVGLSLTVSLGSSRAGAAILASALDEGRLDRRAALWGTLALAFPAYLRRWPATFALCASMAGGAGAVFAVVLLLRSAARFALALVLLRGGGGCGGGPEVGPGGGGAARRGGLLKGLHAKLLRTLPLAWALFAAAYALVPWLEGAFQRWFMGGTFLPLSGWAVAAASIAHVSAALSLAGGGLASGDLSPAQAVFALLLGNGLGILTRAVRQNAGYYFGLFPPDLARSMLFWNVGTMLPLVLLSLLLAALPLG